MIKTNDDFHWVMALHMWWKYRFFFISNKGMRGKGVITFTASPVNAAKKNYADLY
jgi:hypothetical protein